MGAVVDHGGCPLTGARFREVDADPRTPAYQVTHVHAFSAQHADGCVPNRIDGQPRDVTAVDAEMREADCDVRLAAAEGGLQHGRLQQPFHAWRAQPHHQFAETHHAWSHRDTPASAGRALATAATNSRADWVIASNRRSFTAVASTSAVPTPIATAPARIQSAALAFVTPPVGISFRCGSGPRMSLKNAGPSEVAGNTFTMSAPASQAVRISVGVKQPGITATSRARQAAMTSPRSTGPTTNWAPASITASAVVRSTTVPAPTMQDAGRACASS